MHHMWHLYVVFLWHNFLCIVSKLFAHCVGGIFMGIFIYEVVSCIFMVYI